MKIGFCGAGGTGKTTLAKDIASLTGLPFQQSPSRACFKARGIVTEDDQNSMTAELRLLLQMDIFEAIDKQFHSTDKGIFDRTHLDNLFYALFRCHDSLLQHEIDRMYHVTKEALQKFDILVFCPMYDWPQIGDGMRTVTYAPRLLASNFIRAFLMVNDIEFVTTTNHSQQARTAVLYDYIKGKQNNTSAYVEAFKGGR